MLFSLIVSIEDFLIQVFLTFTKSTLRSTPLLQELTYYFHYYDGTQNNRIRNQTIYHRTYFHGMSLCLQGGRHVCLTPM